MKFSAFDNSASERPFSLSAPLHILYQYTFSPYFFSFYERDETSSRTAKVHIYSLQSLQQLRWHTELIRAAEAIDHRRDTGRSARPLKEIDIIGGSVRHFAKQRKKVNSIGDQGKSGCSNLVSYIINVSRQGVLKP